MARLQHDGQAEAVVEVSTVNIVKLPGHPG